MATYKATSTSARIVISLLCLLAGTAAAYFLGYIQPDKAPSMIDVSSNVQQLTQQELPVHVLTPPSVGYGGVVPELQNAATKQFKLKVTVRRPGSTQQHEWLIQLEPNQTLSLSQQGGWKFAGGDELELVQDGYRPRKVRLQ